MGKPRPGPPLPGTHAEAWRPQAGGSPDPEGCPRGDSQTRTPSLGTTATIHPNGSRLLPAASCERGLGAEKPWVNAGQVWPHRLALLPPRTLLWGLGARSTSRFALSTLSGAGHRGRCAHRKGPVPPGSARAVVTSALHRLRSCRRPGLGGRQGRSTGQRPRSTPTRRLRLPEGSRRPARPGWGLGRSSARAEGPGWGQVSLPRPPSPCFLHFQKVLLESCLWAPGWWGRRGGVEERGELRPECPE